MATPKIRLLEDRVLVLPHDEERQTKSGLILPHAVKDEKPIEATVIAIGPELEDRLVPGDIVQYRFGEGLEIELDGVTYVVIRETGILVVNDPQAIDAFEAVRIVKEIADWFSIPEHKSIPLALKYESLQLVYPDFRDKLLIRKPHED